MNNCRFVTFYDLAAGQYMISGSGYASKKWNNCIDDCTTFEEAVDNLPWAIDKSANTQTIKYDYFDPEKKKWIEIGV